MARAQTAVDARLQLQWETGSNASSVTGSVAGSTPAQSEAGGGERERFKDGHGSATSAMLEMEGFRYVLLFALNCLPSTVCPQLLFALNYCLPSTVCLSQLFALN